MTLPNGDVLTHWRFTKVYTRRADAWVVAAMHASAIAEGISRALAERCVS